MTFDEICTLINSGQQMNPLEWAEEDRLRYVMVTMAAVHTNIDHLMTDHLGVSDDITDDTLGNNVSSDNRNKAFRECDMMLLMLHNCHTLLQSVLTPEQRKEALREKAEKLLGLPVKEARKFGAGLVVQVDNDWVADALPEDFSA